MGFPQMCVPPNHPNFHMIFHEINHPAIGDFPFMETPIEQPWNSPATWRHWPVTNILRIHVVFCQLLAVRATDGAQKPAELQIQWHNDG